MQKLIAICNQKGGVGKTTTCINLAAALGVFEFRVLVIDTDPQANALKSFGFKPSSRVKENSRHFTNQYSIIKQHIKPTNEPNVDILEFTESQLNVKQNELFNAETLSNLKKRYDYILIDCVPILHGMTFNVLKTVDSVIIPLQCEFYALEGLSQLLKTIIHIKEKYNNKLDIDGLLITMFDMRLNANQSVFNTLNQHFKNIVFKTIIHRNTNIGQASIEGKSVIKFDASAKGSEDYLNLAKELIQQQQEFKTQSTQAGLISINSKKLKNTIVLSQRHSEAYNKLSTPLKPLDVNNMDHNVLIGLDKTQLIQKIGLQFNDINHKVWVYSLKHVKHLFLKRKGYLYLFFKGNTVSRIQKTRYKLKLNPFDLVENIKS